MDFRRFALAAALAALALPALAAGPMKAGQWQVTMESKMSGIDMKMPPMTFEHCVTPEEAAKPQPPKAKNDMCKIEDYKLDGNVITWKVKCDKPQAMTGDGKMTFSAESYEGLIHMKMAQGMNGQPMEITQKMTGKRIGDCKK